VRTPGVQALAVCDVDRWRLERAALRIEEQYTSGKAKGRYVPVDPYVDYRDLLARDDIDAVMISTPDHWHATMAIDAMKAGKHVALEKPIQRTIAEGRRMAEAARKYQRVFRVDSEFRSGRPAVWATSIVRNGYLGRLKRVLVAVPGTDVGCPPQPEMPVPPELDYERWQGPAPRAPYTEKRVHPRHDLRGRPGWMRHLYYCDGMITNWSTHLNDGAMWAAGKERTGPVEIEGTGVYPEPESFWNVLLKFEVHYRFADGLDWTLKTDAPYFIIEGEEGWIRAGFREMDAQPKSLLSAQRPRNARTGRGGPSCHLHGPAGAHRHSTGTQTALGSATRRVHRRPASQCHARSAYPPAPPRLSREPEVFGTSPRPDRVAAGRCGSIGCCTGHLPLGPKSARAIVLDRPTARYGHCCGGANAHVHQSRTLI